VFSPDNLPLKHREKFRRFPDCRWLFNPCFHFGIPIIDAR